MKKHVAPIIATFLLLLPALYVGSYIALATPKTLYSCRAEDTVYAAYRAGGDAAVTFFYPLEQIDRKVRPKTWE